MYNRSLSLKYTGRSASGRREDSRRRPLGQKVSHVLRRRPRVIVVVYIVIVFALSSRGRPWRRCSRRVEDIARYLDAGVVVVVVVHHHHPIFQSFHERVFTSGGLKRMSSAERSEFGQGHPFQGERVDDDDARRFRRRQRRG